MKQIAPGGQGTIKLSFHTGGYGGPVQQIVEIFTNDPAHRVLNARISGNVEPFVQVDPPRILLNGKVGQPLTAKATITPRPDYPFKVTQVAARRGQFIAYKVDPAPLADGRSGYVLTVENRKTDAGRYADLVEIGIDSPLRSLIRVQVIGEIQN